MEALFVNEIDTGEVDRQNEGKKGVPEIEIHPFPVQILEKEKKGGAFVALCFLLGGGCFLVYVHTRE